MRGKQNGTPELCPLESVLQRCYSTGQCHCVHNGSNLPHVLSALSRPTWSAALWQLINTVTHCTPGICKRRGMQFLQEGQVKVEQLIPSSGGNRGQGSWLLLWRYFNAYLHPKPFLVYPDIVCKNISKEEKELIPHIFNFVSFLVLCWDLNCINVGSSNGISGLIRKQTV